MRRQPRSPLKAVKKKKTGAGSDRHSNSGSSKQGKLALKHCKAHGKADQQSVSSSLK